jgi:hypothetical protein
LFLKCSLIATIHVNVLSSLISFLNIKVRNEERLSRVWACMRQTHFSSVEQILPLFILHGN